MNYPELYEMLKHNALKGDLPGWFRVPDERPFFPAGVIITLIIRATP
jgi:hypothetical protein